MKILYSNEGAEHIDEFLIQEWHLLDLNLCFGLCAKNRLTDFNEWNLVAIHVLSIQITSIQLRKTEMLC